MLDPIVIRREQVRRAQRRKYEQSLKAFTFAAWPLLEPGTEIKWAWPLDVMVAYIEAWYRNQLLRGNDLIINVPPGTMKSLLLSVFSTAWAWTWNPYERFINLTNEIGLATRDSTKMRFLIQSDWYQYYWGDRVRISSEQREKTHFTNTATGFRQGRGFESNITGKRGSRLLIDDPIDAKKAFSDIEVQTVNDVNDQVVSTRLSDPVKDSKCLIMQRLRTNDLTGHWLSKKQRRHTHLVIPMRYEGFPAYDPVKDLGSEFAHLKDPRTKVGELMWPDRFPDHVVKALEEDLGDYGTAGQLQQRPTPMGGGILKKKWFRVWGRVPWTKKIGLPTPIHIVCSVDSAFSEKDLKANSYSAATVWSVFEIPPLPSSLMRNRTSAFTEHSVGEAEVKRLDDMDGRTHETRYGLFLLEAWYGRVGYPELREKMLAFAKRHLDAGKGDAFLIEKKASGLSLISDLRRNPKLRVRGYDPKHDGDKVARAHLASPPLKVGTVWIPDLPWAHKIVEIVSEFPAGGPPCSDLTDTATQAIRYVQKRRFIEHPDDIDDDPEYEEDNENAEPICSAYG